MPTRILTTLIAVFALLAHMPAHAAIAYLVRCESTSSVTGKFIYVGTYQYSGQQFTFTFTSYCPYSVEVH